MSYRCHKRVKILRPRQYGRHFPDDIFKCIFMNKNVWISIKMSLNFVPKGTINNIPSLFQIMACRLVDTKPLSEPMMVSFLMHICVTWLQWVKTHGIYRDIGWPLWMTSSSSQIYYRFLYNHFSYKEAYSTFQLSLLSSDVQITKFMGPTWGPPGSCRPQMGPMLAPWTLLSGWPSFGPVMCPLNNWICFSRCYTSFWWNLLSMQFFYDAGPMQ